MYDSPVLQLLLVANTVFRPGERLEYDIRYGPVVLGNLDLRVLHSETIAGVECRHMYASLELTGTLGWIFWARYTFESWATSDSLVTLRSHKHTSETNYYGAWTADFDRKAGIARYTDGSEYTVPHTCRDLLTLWYWFRTCSLLPGLKVTADAHVDKKNYRVQATITRQTAVRTPAGTFDCIVLTPTTTGPLGTVFLANRPDRIPVVIRTRIAGLPVSAVLKRSGIIKED